MRTRRDLAGERLVSGDFNLEDFLKQMQQIKRMGPIGKLLGDGSRNGQNEQGC